MITDEFATLASESIATPLVGEIKKNTSCNGVPESGVSVREPLPFEEIEYAPVSVCPNAPATSIVPVKLPAVEMATSLELITAPLIVGRVPSA